PLLGGARTPKSGSDTAFQGADSPRFDRGGAEHPSPQVPDHHDPHGLVGVPAVAVTSPIRSTHEKEAVDGAPAQYPDNGFLSSGTGLLDPSSESDRSLREETSKEMLSPPPQQTPQARSPLAPAGLRIQKVSGGLEKDAGLSSIAAERFRGPDTERKGRLASRVGAKRPARLDVDAVRDAEARGSLTSLPDLIKRATRLASNLDRGQTASRPGTNRFEGCTGNEKHRSVQSSENRYSGSISDILASFPPPGFASNNASRKSIKQWPGGGLARAALPSDSDAGEAHRQRRRCCGMPLWAFCLLLLALILLVAAAVIVPVTLIVIPRQQNDGARASASVASCQQSLACQNGGANVVAPDGACRCLCVNGFTGVQCTTSSGAGCASANVAGADGATVGSAIPRLLSGASANYSIPLDGRTILGLFSATNLSCASENALVTFNGLARRAAGPAAVGEGMDLLAGDGVGVLPTKTLALRQASSSGTSTAQLAIATSDGI
ncbi:hypothetical protein LTR28_013628, partial [Elasticomyces elasticus]